MPDLDFPDLPELSRLRDLPVAPPPAAQIRRRGDERRHRTQLLGVAGVAVVVALIVAPLTMFGRSDHSAPPPPIATDSRTPSPTLTNSAGPGADTHRTIPDWFPLGQPLGEHPQMTADDAVDGALSEVDCSQSKVWGLGGTIDALWARSTAGGDQGQQLGLFLYPDAGSAHDALATVKHKVDACVAAGRSGTTTPYSVRVSNLPSGYGFAEASDSGELAGYVFLAEGNALLVGQIQDVGGQLIDGSAQAQDLVDSLTANLYVLPADLAYFEDPAGGTVFGPRAYGDLRLGMSYDDAMATGKIPASTTPGGLYDLGDGTQLCLSRKDGLMSIIAGNALRTPEGIRVGSTVSELKAAYPNITMTEGNGSVPLDSHTEWQFGISAQLVESVELTEDDQTCGP